jgi:hypothetical protein
MLGFFGRTGGDIYPRVLCASTDGGVARVVGKSMPDVSVNRHFNNRPNLEMAPVVFAISMNEN